MKVRRFSEYQSQIAFPNFDQHRDSIYQAFLTTRLGSLYQAIPWDQLVRDFNLKEYTKGPHCIFSPRGKIGLMFLKHYAACSDSKLIEHLNANVHYQIFCDNILSPDRPISNFKLVSEIRCEFASQLE